MNQLDGPTPGTPSTPHVHQAPHTPHAHLTPGAASPASPAPHQHPSARPTQHPSPAPLKGASPALHQHPTPSPAQHPSPPLPQGPSPRPAQHPTPGPAAATPVLAGLHRPTAEETAFGWLFGRVPAPLPEPDARGARRVLEDELLLALRDGQTYVAFSGGRDSSALLALAVHLARREGLPEPTAVTLTYPGDAEAEESEWARLVVRHLRLRQWLRLPVADGEAATLGPTGRQLLDLTGHPIFPPAAAATSYLAQEVARHSEYRRRGSGPVLVTGEHGDEVLGGRRAAALALTAQRWGRVPGWVHRRAIKALAPSPVVRSRAQTGAEPPEWLRPAAAERFAELTGRDAVGPLLAGAEIRRLATRRAIAVGTRTTAAVAAVHGIQRLDPFGSATFLATWSREGGSFGFPNRAAALRHLVGTLLPEDVLTRTSKARFNASRFGPAAAWYAKHWDGSLGHELAELVDSAALRAAWRQPAPHALSLSLLQQVWLDTGRGTPWAR